MRVFLLSHIGNKAQKISRILDFLGSSFHSHIFPFLARRCFAREDFCVCRRDESNARIPIHSQRLILHHMTWMIKRLHFYMPSHSAMARVLPSSSYIRIKNSFVKCDSELMAFLLMNHRMEIEFHVWKGLAFISLGAAPLRSSARVDSNSQAVAERATGTVSFSARHKRSETA